MRILYVATDQAVPGATGGSVHVMEVAQGLASRGHDVHVVARAGRGTDSAPAAEFALHPIQPLVPHRFFRWTLEPTVGRLIDAIGAELVVERYYNFAGEGIRAAHRRGLPSVLEVNSPIVDYPGSLKSRVDPLLLGLMRRLRESQCRRASAVVTPLPAIVPASVPAERIHRIPWGANVARFRPGVSPDGPASELPIPDGARVVAFSSSFRPWHGAERLVEAAARVVHRADSAKAFFLFLGAGPQLPSVLRRIDRVGLAGHAFVAGAVPYESMPSYLARSHIGVAPYEPGRHGQLKLGFYWSPLKIFEYMASGLPVVTLDVEPLREIVRPGREGILVPEEDDDALVDAIAKLVVSPEQAFRMGRSARERIVSRFSWQIHCEKLEAIFEEIVKSKGSTE